MTKGIRTRGVLQLFSVTSISAQARLPKSAWPMGLLNLPTTHCLGRLRLITPARGSHGISLGTAAQCSAAASACIPTGSPKRTSKKNSGVIRQEASGQLSIAQDLLLQSSYKAAATSHRLGSHFRVRFVPLLLASMLPEVSPGQTPRSAESIRT